MTESKFHRIKITLEPKKTEQEKIESISSFYNLTDEEITEFRLLAARFNLLLVTPGLTDEFGDPDIQEQEEVRDELMKGQMNHFVGLAEQGMGSVIEAFNKYWDEKYSEMKTRNMIEEAVMKLKENLRAGT